MAKRIVAAMIVASALIAGPSAGQTDARDIIATAERLRDANDDSGAYRLLKPLSDRGNPDAQFLLAELHSGFILPNEAEAARLYRLAAQSGHLRAQRYLCNSGDPENPREAAASFVWCRAAAEQGDGEAQVDLAWRYREGRGVRADPVQARMWLRAMIAARDQGGRPSHCREGEQQVAGNWLRPSGPGSWGFVRNPDFYSFCLAQTAAGPTLAFRYGNARELKVQFEAPRDGRFTLIFSEYDSPGAGGTGMFSSETYFTQRGATFALREFMVADTGASLENQGQCRFTADHYCVGGSDSTIDNFAAVSVDENGEAMVMSDRFIHQLPAQLGSPTAIRRLFSDVVRRSE